MLYDVSDVGAFSKCNKDNRYLILLFETNFSVKMSHDSLAEAFLQQTDVCIYVLLRSVIKEADIGYMCLKLILQQKCLMNCLFAGSV